MSFIYYLATDGLFGYMFGVISTIFSLLIIGFFAIQNERIDKLEKLNNTNTKDGE